LIAKQTISSQFVAVGSHANERNVFVRYAGRGPAIVLLHQSPQNSRTLIPWIERLAQSYAVFAPDTPGFGFSDPLPLAQPMIPDYAAALNALLEKLGIDRVLVYGVHTGAVTALRFALDYPHRVAGLVCDGYARFDAAERQSLLGDYLPPFEPKWDGTHLLWLFARFREQNLFFPWNTPTLAARLAYPLPTTAKLHSDVMDVLDAGDGYRVGYRAPFLYDDPTAAARLTVPSAIFYRAEDVLEPHLARLPALPEQVTAERVEGGPAALMAKCDAVFQRFAHTATVIDSEVAIDAAKSSKRFISHVDNGSLACRSHAGDVTCAEIHLHDIGTPAVMPSDAKPGAFVLLPDLPNHGASRDWMPDSVTIETSAKAILSVADKLALTNITIRATGGACAIAAALAKHLGAQCAKLILVDPLPLNKAEREQFLHSLPDLTPVATGAHLIAAWNWARLQHLFWPWLIPDANAAREVDAPSPYRVHADVVEMVRAGESFAVLWASALNADLESIIAKLGCVVRVSCGGEAERVRLAERLITRLNLNPTDSAVKGMRQWQSPN
jgi:pimeloyl-ACP methyl ester carboxylesterase